MRTLHFCTAIGQNHHVQKNCLINSPFNPELINNTPVHFQVTNLFDFLYAKIEVLYNDIEMFLEFCPVEEILSNWILYHVRNTNKFLKERKIQNI